MGNEHGKSPQKTPSIKNFIIQRKSYNSSISTETSVLSPERRWQGQLLQTLDELAKHKKWKEMSHDIKEIVLSLNPSNFTKSLNALNKMSSMELKEFESFKNKSLTSSDLEESKYVIIEPNHVEMLQKSNNSPSKIIHKKSLQTIRKQVGYIIRKELNQEYHPINDMKQSFMMMFQMKFRQMLDLKPCKDLQEKTQIEELMFQDIDFFCELTVKGCLIYKPWVIKQTGIKETKYVTFAKKMVVESLFSKHSMHEKIFPFLLQFNSKYIEKISSKIGDFVKVENFHIQPQLQIEGHFIGSLMLFSQIDTFMSPRKTLQQLNRIKANICNDIENYHQTFKTGQVYTIDGDNLLSIVCFMLCKLRIKLLPIYCQLELLFVAYGDNLASVFEEASYMVSTITAAFQYLAGDDFKG